jgi:tetratricopeptide (TPR) repeat protein
MRAAVARRDKQAFLNLAREVKVATQPPQSLAPVGNALIIIGSTEDAVELLRRAWDAYPGDFWINLALGQALRVSQPPQLDEAVAFLTVAVALRPRSPGAHLNLGLALKEKGHQDKAIACFKKAIALDPKYAGAHNNLGIALLAKGKVDEAIACYQKAIDLDPGLAPAHGNLGNALKAKGPGVDEAIACWRKAIALDPRLAPAHHNLGNALANKGKVDEAIACWRKVIQLDPKSFAQAHFNLGTALAGKGRFDEAIACLRKAIALDPKYADAHCNLGNALLTKGQLDEAIACFKKAIALDPKDAFARGSLGQTLIQQGQFSEAQQSLRVCLDLLPSNHPMRGATSRLLRQCRQLIDIDSKLKAYLSGKETTADAATQAQMAVLAQQPSRRLYLSAARLYRDAFARQPQLADVHRYHAACAAALAGTCQGKDVARLVDNDRAELRYSALCWLQEYLSARAQQLASNQPGTSDEVRQSLLHLPKDPDFAAVRDRAALGKLPEAEQVAWLNLWSQVDTLLLLARTTLDK